MRQLRGILGSGIKPTGRKKAQKNEIYILRSIAHKSMYTCSPPFIHTHMRAAMGSKSAGPRVSSRYFATVKHPPCTRLMKTDCYICAALSHCVPVMINNKLSRLIRAP